MRDQHDREVAGDRRGPRGPDWPARVPRAARPPAAAARDRSRGSGWPGAGRGGPRPGRCRGGGAGPGPGSRPGRRCARTSPGRGTCRPAPARPRATGRRAVEKMRRALSPGPSRTRRRRLKIGSSTAPAVFDSGRPSITDIGVRMLRAPAEEARPVGLVLARRPPACPSTTTVWAAQTAGSAARPGAAGGQQGAELGERTRSGRRGWRTPGGRRPRRAERARSRRRTSARARAPAAPRFVTETRRISASSSGETTTSSVVVIAPSRRWISARSSEKVDPVAVGLGAGGLVAGRPDRAAVDVAHEDVASPRRPA